MVGGRIEGVSTHVSGGGTLSYTGAASGITYGVSGADTALTMTQALLIQLLMLFPFLLER